MKWTAYMIILINAIYSIELKSQSVPSEDSNIPYLVTFGGNSRTSWGDDDFSQSFFFVVPISCQNPIYIRVFDPDISDGIDELKGEFNTQTEFSVYGGKGCISTKEAKGHIPEGIQRSGDLLASKTFGNDIEYDNGWYTFDPFDPRNGELVPEYGGYIFKVIADGKAGDDGNLYRYYLSTDPNTNKDVEGGNSFTFEYSFRLSDDPQQVAHIYPFIDQKVVSVKQRNFDWDSDGMIRIVSVNKKGELVKVSGENEWKESEHKISERERGSSLDIRFIKNQNRAIMNNNVVFYVRNQYEENLPFYTIPISGIPNYKPTISVRNL